MPELPEIASYIAAIDRHVGGDVLERIRVKSFSLLRTYDPLQLAASRTVLRQAAFEPPCLQAGRRTMVTLFLQRRSSWRIVNQTGRKSLPQAFAPTEKCRTEYKSEDCHKGTKCVP